MPCDMCFSIYAASCDSSLLMAMISGHLFLMPYLSGKGTDCSFYLRLCVGLEKRGSDKTFFFFFFSSVGITVLFLFLFNQSFFVPLFSFLDFLLAAGTQINMMHIHKETAHSVRQLQASHFPLEMSHGHETSLGLLM